MPFSALLDANVLVANALRDTLLRVAEAGLYRPYGVPTSSRRHDARLLAPFGIDALHPDTFLCHQYDLAPTALVTIINEQVADTGRRGRPRLSPEDLLEALTRAGAPTFAARMRSCPTVSEEHRR